MNNLWYDYFVQYLPYLDKTVHLVIFNDERILMKEKSCQMLKKHSFMKSILKLL